MIKKLMMGIVAALIATPALADYGDSGVYVEDYDPFYRTNEVAVYDAADYESVLDFNQAYNTFSNAIENDYTDFVRTVSITGDSAFIIRSVVEDSTAASHQSPQLPEHLQGTCSVNTTAANNTYWMNKHSINSWSDLQYQLAFNGERSNGNNGHAASYCWLQWFNSHDVDDLSSNAEDVLGWDPGYYENFTDDYDAVAFYVQLNITNYTAIPDGLLDAIPSYDHADFTRGWLIATGVLEGYSAPDGGGVQNHIDYWNTITGTDEATEIGNPSVTYSTALSLLNASGGFGDAQAVGLYALHGPSGLIGYYTKIANGNWVEYHGGTLAENQAIAAEDIAASVIDYYY